MKIFSLLENENIHFDEEIYISNGYVHLVKMLDEFYLGTKYLIIEVKDSGAWRGEIWKSIIGYGFSAFIFFMLFGLYLAKLFLKPMRDSIVLLDRFIKDTTHELNTPISTILTNIEMLETFGKCKKNDELQRIEIASKTLSRIYDDLTYLNLNHDYYRRIESINVSDFIKERMLYFMVMAEHKRLDIEVNIDENVTLQIDKNDLTRLVDNLITNASKYNKQEGLLKLSLSKESLSVTDTGVGIQKKDLDTIVCRFKRANKSEGGFGIGLDIVNQVVNSYGFVLHIISELKKGTEVEIRWEK